MSFQRAAALRAKDVTGEGCGTVFRLSTTRKENVIYSFRGGSDGANPDAGLITLNGVLYGTTHGESSGDYGTVYSVTTTGTETR